MFRNKFTLYGRPLLLVSYISGVYTRGFDKLLWNRVRAGKRLLSPPFTLSFLKDAFKTFPNRLGIRVALKRPLEFPHLLVNRLCRSDLASRIAYTKFLQPRWPGQFKQLARSLRAAGSRVWVWRMRAVLPVVVLAIFALWFGSLVREFSVPAPTLVRQPMPPAAADPGTDLKGWVDSPRPMIVIRPEVVHESPPVPDIPQLSVTTAPSLPKLSVTQIFARLDRGEITMAETKVLLAAKSPVPPWESSPNSWSDD